MRRIVTRFMAVLVGMSAALCAVQTYAQQAPAAATERPLVIMVGHTN